MFVTLRNLRYCILSLVGFWKLHNEVVLLFVMNLMVYRTHGLQFLSLSYENHEIGQVKEPD